MDRDVVGLADVQGQARAVQALAEQVPAEERRDAAGAGDDLQDSGQDLVLQDRQHLPRPAGKVTQASASAVVIVRVPRASSQVMNSPSSLSSRSSLNPRLRRSSR
jgi:hypothetical protein